MHQARAIRHVLTALANTLTTSNDPEFCRGVIEVAARSIFYLVPWPIKLETIIFTIERHTEKVSVGKPIEEQARRRLLRELTTYEAV